MLRDGGAARTMTFLHRTQCVGSQGKSKDVSGSGREVMGSRSYELPMTSDPLH